MASLFCIVIVFNKYKKLSNHKNALLPGGVPRPVFEPA